MDIRPPSRGQTAAEFFALMRPQFTAGEWGRIEAPPDDAGQLRRFYENWSLKESYIKALGVGLGMNLLRLDFTPDAALSPTAPGPCTAAALRVDGELLPGWRFEQWYLDAEHTAAVALGPPREGADEAAPFVRLSFGELVEGATPLRDPQCEGSWARLCEQKDKLRPGGR